MKKYIGVILICFGLFAGNIAKAQDKSESKAKTEQTEVKKEGKSFKQVVKDKFVEGGPIFMGFVLLCLILGLAIAIERIITLNLSSVNSKKLLVDVEQALDSGGTDKARELCANTRGPVASILAQGLIRQEQGVAEVEKSIISYGSVEMGKLEKGMTWISLFINLAPLLGFMGTVWGMIVAFDTIALAGEMEIDKMATGIKQALLTTIAGLIVAVILQIFYNYCVSKIDSLVNQMEESSTKFVDLLLKKEGR